MILMPSFDERWGRDGEVFRLLQMFIISIYLIME